MMNFRRSCNPSTATLRRGGNSLSHFQLTNCRGGCLKVIKMQLHGSSWLKGSLSLSAKLGLRKCGGSADADADVAAVEWPPI